PRSRRFLAGRRGAGTLPPFRTGRVLGRASRLPRADSPAHPHRGDVDHHPRQRRALCRDAGSDPLRRPRRLPGALPARGPLLARLRQAPARTRVTILIVSYIYAPDHSPRAYRWSAIAEHWAAQGRRVEVIAGWKSGDARREDRSGVTVHRVGGGLVET